MKFSTLTLAFVAWFLTGIGHVVSAQDSQQADTLFLNLKQAQECAIKYNANSKNSRLDMAIAKKKIMEVTAIGLPQINAQLNYQHLFVVPELNFGGSTFLTTNLPAGTPITSDDILNNSVYLGYQPGSPIPLAVKDNLTLDITVSQLVFSGEYLVGLQASKVYYQISQQSNEKTELDLKESVSNTYSLLLVLEQTLKVLNQSYENLKSTLAEMQAMNEQGFIENTDVDQIELTTLNLENGVNSLSRQLDAARQLMKFQLGVPFDNTIVLTESLESVAGEMPVESITTTKFDLKNNINYKILNTSVALADLNLKREKSTYIPSIAAFYRHQEKANQPAFDFNPKDVFGLTMNIPIFASGSRMSKVGQRRLELEKATNTRDNVANGLELEFINVRNELISAYDKYLNDQKNIALTQRVYDKTLAKFKEGMSSSLDLTNAQNQYLTAQSNYYNAVYALIAAKNKLNKLTNRQ